MSTLTTSPGTWACLRVSRGRSSEDSVEDPPGQLRAPRPAELSGTEDAPAAQVGRHVRITAHLLERLSPRLRAVGGHHDGGVADHLWQAGRVTDDHRR